LSRAPKKLGFEAFALPSPASCTTAFLQRSRIPHVGTDMNAPALPESLRFAPTLRGHAVMLAQQRRKIFAFVRHPGSPLIRPQQLCRRGHGGPQRRRHHRRTATMICAVLGSALAHRPGKRCIAGVSKTQGAEFLRGVAAISRGRPPDAVGDLLRACDAASIGYADERMPTSQGERLDPAARPAAGLTG